jgi:DNA-binding NtrC family response regulator/tetratricopeptide (TPR) repeat protein
MVLTELLGSSPAVVALREEVRRLLERQTAGRSLPPILIEGETGTGKGLLASAIHRAGARHDGPFVAVNCAAIPETLMEAELFGFERGAFTDARQPKAGLVEAAHRGTLFLDEIGLLPQMLQGKLLTVLEERAVRRLGRTRSDPVDIAILAATIDDLRRTVRERRFSEALYHRLSVLTLRLPPLRERGEDVILLAQHWLARSAAEYGVPAKSLGPDARAALLAYEWPGNVRELRNRMERVTLLAEPGLVTARMLGLGEPSHPDAPESAMPPDARLRARLGNLERETLFATLTSEEWNITRAAARLGVPPTTLRYRLRKHGLLREQPPGATAPAPARDRAPARERADAPAATSPLESTATLLTPLVGRQQEIELLLERWRHVTEGTGQAVLIGGEAGIGKSRLVRAFEERIGGEPRTQLVFTCSPHHRNSALYPVIDHLERRLAFRREDTPQEKVRKLEAALGGYRLPLGDAVPVFAPLLSLPIPDRYPALTLAPARRRQKTLEVILAWLLEEAERQVTLVVWEDLQWADPSTLELLGLLLEQAPTARLFIVMTSRPDGGLAWLARPHLTHFALGRLSRGQTEAMVANVLGGQALRSDLLQQLVARTDGVPLYVEELTRMVIEAGSRIDPLPALAIPSTLHDSLLARLDRLGAGREVAQLGAVLGREFSCELILAVSPMDEATVQRELARLVEAQILYRKGVPPHERYLFKHALIQDAAYHSLLKSARQQHHERIARVLEERFRDAAALHPELVAHHYTEAGLVAEAVVHWHRAGQRAIERSASAEALVHLRRGLELLETLPDTPGHAQQELALQLTLGAALLMTTGYTAPEVEAVYARARALRASAQDSPQLFLTLSALWRFHISRGELETAHDLGQECFALAQRLGDPALRVNVRFALGVNAFHLGRFAAALEHLEHGIAMYDPAEHATLTFFHGYHFEVACRCYAARTLWFLGYPDRALAQSQHAMTLARQSSHTYTIGYALHQTQALHTCRRDAHVVRQLAETAIALARDQGFERWLGAGLIRRGWALAEQGAPAEGIAQLREGLDTWGSQLGSTHFLAMLAEAHARGGDFEAGLRVVDVALAVAETSAEHHYEAELHRVRGELALPQERARQEMSLVEPDVCFHRALEIARGQGATSLELRAVTSLGRLQASHGKHREARQMLGEVYGRFTEGFDTADLREARALLDQLE